MLSDPYPHIRRAAHLGIPALVVCLGLLPPVAASGKTRHESGASASPPSTESSSPPSTGNSESTVPSTEPIAAPPAETGADTSSEARLARREERLARREERHAQREERQAQRNERPVVTLLTPAAGAALPLGVAGTGAHASGDDAVTFTGTVSPTSGSMVVALQREDAAGDGRWHRIAMGQISDDGNYTITHTFGRQGEAHLRVVVHYRGLDMAAASAPATYRIARRQHAQLTIEASADAVSYGQSVTIGGIVAGAADQPVTLLQRSSTGVFEAVATATTGASGEYTFTESPLQNTRYRVTSGAVSSVALPESVTYALTAEPSASTIQAGEQLTVSGDVNPAHAGQTVHLERQNPSGVGFHAVASGTVGSDSSYSIAFVASQPGTYLMRVTVPGDQLNAPAASPPFSVQVTPASG